MLVSHRKKFIFTKTRKTAGTSVESVFEPYCMPEGTWEQIHYAPERISPDGIIGHRGDGWKKANWWNHMPAELIRNRVGEEIWNEYFKFTVIRNPFDKLVSGFHMQWAHYAQVRQQGYLQKFKVMTKRFLGRALPIELVKGNNEIERFRSWIRAGGVVVSDQETYMIDGKVCLDHFIRYENLENGVREVMLRLDVDPSGCVIPKFKSNFRKSRTPIVEYYDAETEAIVRRLYAWELNFFNYDLK